ncbi:ABC transporter substrate-binding protein [Gordonia sp. NPDC003376]
MFTSHRRRAGLLGVLALATVSLLALAGCSSDSGSADSSAGNPAPASGDVDLGSVTLRVGQTGWATTENVLKIAGENNTPYHVEYSVFSGGDQQLQALQSGAIDVAQSSEIPPVFAAAGGTVKFKQVAVQTGTTLLQEVIVPADSSITSIKELKGKEVGYVKNTTAAYFLNELLKQNGLTWNDIKPRPLLPNDGLAALNGGSIDAFASYGNTIINAHQHGAKTIGSGRDILSGNFPWSVSTDVLTDAKQQAAVVDLLTRINRAYAYLRDGHQQQYAEAFAAATKQPVSSALQQFTDGEAQRPTKIGPPTQTVIDSQQQVADSLTEIKALPKKIDVTDLWSDQLAAALTAALQSTPATTPAGS